MSRASRAGLTALGVAAAAALLWLALRPDPVRVDVGRVTRGPLAVTVDEEGQTRVRDRYVVAAPVSGRLQRIEREEGDAVAAGDVVARIDPAPLDPRTRFQAEARLAAALSTQREAEARVRQARAALAQAERELRRARKLAAAGTLADQELEKADLEHTSRMQEHGAVQEAADAASHEVQAARAALMQAQEGSVDGATPDDSLVEVRAPAAGQVLRIPEKSQRVVAVGTPLLEVGDPARLEIVVDVLSADAVKVRPGAPMVLEAWGGERPLAGAVRRVEPSGFTKLSALGVEEQRVNVIGDFVGDPGALGDGYRLEARIVVWQEDDVLQVPASALFRREDRWHVFALDGRVARLRPLEIGARSSEAAQVLSGLSEGDEVVLHPTDKLADGVRIAPF